MTVVEKRLTINVPIEQVWDALTNPASIEQWMNDPSVVINLQENGGFELFGGETLGKFSRIQEPTLLEYSWRQDEWPKEWADSLVRWELTPDGKTTNIHLTHSQFPNDDERASHDEGWDSYWLEPMKEWLESGRPRHGYSS